MIDMQNRGTLKVPSRMGCPIGEVRTLVSGKCFKVLKAQPQHSFNVRNKTTGRIITSTATGGKNTFSAILQTAKDRSERVPVIVTFEQVIWDSRRDKKLDGRYIFRNHVVMKTGYVP